MTTLLQNPFINIIARALAVYVFIIVAIRVFGKKELTQLSVIDLVFILLISNAVQNAMVGQDSSLTGGLVAAGALFIANYIFKQLLFRHRKLSDLLQGEALTLIYKGSVNEANRRKAEITMEELSAAVREHGAESISDVDLAVLEVDGNISVISHDFKKRSVHHPRKHRLKGRLLKS